MQQNPNLNYVQQPSNISQQYSSNSCFQQSKISSMPPNYSNQYFQQQIQNQNMQQNINQNIKQNQPNPISSMPQCCASRNLQQQPSNSQFEQQSFNPSFQQNQPNPISSMPPHFSSQNFTQQSSNSNFEHQSSNNNFEQQTFNSNFQNNQSNPISSMPPHLSSQNFMQQSSNSNFEHQSSNNNFEQQSFNPNSQYNQPNPISSMPPHFSSQNIPQQSSNSNFQHQTVNPISSMPQHYQNASTSQNQTFNPQSEIERSYHGFLVVYDDFSFVVDPYSLIKSSRKCRELIGPFINDYTQMKEVHLSVHGNQFSKRCMNNFLKICQQLPTDVQNREMKEICEIAKMFEADEIYNKGLAFIQANEDPNFNVPDSKYDGSDGITYLTVDNESNLILHDSDIEDSQFDDEDDENDSYFEDADDQYYKGSYLRINNNSTNKDDDNGNESNPNNSSNEINIENDNSNGNKQSNSNADQNNGINISNNNNNDANANGKPKKKTRKIHSVVYQIKYESHVFKCPTFKFVCENNVLFTAKQKYNEIFIAEGAEVHIRNKDRHVYHIHQNGSSKANRIEIGDREFEVKYVGSGNVNHYSIESTFVNNGQTLTWIPKPPRFNPKTGKFYLNFHGEYHHTPVTSSKNIILQNKDHKTTCIICKMDSNTYEIECLPAVEPLIAFTIGLSDVIGPYLDPLAANGTEHFIY